MRRQAETNGPVLCTHGFAQVRQLARATSVAQLNRPCDPSAVLRRVRAVVVDSIQCVLASGRSAHVGVKRGEVIQPSIAHHDPATTVIRVGAIRRVDTSLFRALPYRITRHAAKSVRSRLFYKSRLASTATCSRIVLNVAQAVQERIKRATAPIASAAHAAVLGGVPSQFLQHRDKTEFDPGAVVKHELNINTLQLIGGVRL